MDNDIFKMVGEVHVCLYDAEGKLKTERTIHNLVVTAGKSLIATALNSGSLAPFTYMAIGSGNTAATAGDTTLGTETARLTTTNTVTTNLISFSGTFAAGVGTGQVGEAGVFNNNTAGTMLARTTFTPFTKASTDSVTITWNVTVG